MELFNVAGAAEFLGVSTARVRQFCLQDRLGQKVGAIWVITKDDLERFASIPRRSGKPYKGSSDEKSGVYLLKCGPYYKIGFSSHIDTRIRQLSTLPPFDVELVHTIPTDDMYGLEASLHDRYADKRKNGEWFELDQADVEYIKGLERPTGRPVAKVEEGE